VGVKGNTKGGCGLALGAPTLGRMNSFEDSTDVLGRRIGAALLDLIVLIVVFVVVGLVFGKGQAHGSSASVNLSGVSAVVYLALVVLYYFVLEATTGQTLGKRALGVRVVRTDGGRLGVGAVAVRTLLRVIDGLPLFYLLGLIVVIATGRRRQRIGDLAAGTTVRRA
jgi:uncharacterized RDD family membrane protein YckC